MLGLLAGFRWFDNPRFMGATAREIPALAAAGRRGRRRLWFILSLVAIGVSIVALAVNGLNLGHRLQGRRADDAVDAEADRRSPTVREQAARSARRRGRAGPRRRDRRRSYKSFQIRLKTLAPAEQQQLTTASRTSSDAGKLGREERLVELQSRQILRGAIIAIVVSFALIALFVTMRYQWRFAVPILRTLVNDVLITLGIYSISGREVSASTVAALLTILGFSIYDTIIVFDRVRENMRLMPRASFARIANVSVWEVLRRSFFTSVITLLPIAALYVFGGATLQDFAFAIMVGIVLGAVGTIFIATPLLASLMEREPEYARRKDILEESESEEPPRRRAARSRPSPSPTTPMDVIEEAVEDTIDALEGDGDDDENGEDAAPTPRRSGFEARTAAPASEDEAAWTSPLATARNARTASGRDVGPTEPPDIASETGGDRSATRSSACSR